MAKIVTPVRGYNGQSASLTFVNGVAETDDPHLIDWFKLHGYQVEEEKAPEKAETAKPKSKGKGG